jgi:hypothetical protein
MRGNSVREGHCVQIQYRVQRILSQVLRICAAVALLTLVNQHQAAAGMISPPKLMPMSCSEIPQHVEENRIYLFYQKSRSLKQDEALAKWDWYQQPPPKYGNGSFDPLAELPIGVRQGAFERKSIDCPFRGNALAGIIFRGSDLTDSRFAGADLEGASFDRFDMDGSSTILHNVTFAGGDLTGASFDHADMAGVHFEPDKLPAARDIAQALNLDKMTYDDDPSALASLRQLFRDSGFSLQDRQINYAIHVRQKELYAGQCTLWAKGVRGSYQSCTDFLGSTLIDWTCQYGMNLWRPVAIGFWAWGLFTVLFFLFMHHPGPSGLYLAVAHGLTLEPEEIRSAPQVRSETAWESLKRGQVIRGIREEFRLLAIAGFFSLINGFNIGFKEADIGRWIRLLPAREFEFRAVGWSRTFAGMQALLTLYLLAVWILCLFSHPFG